MSVWSMRISTWPYPTLREVVDGCRFGMDHPGTDPYVPSEDLKDRSCAVCRGEACVACALVDQDPYDCQHSVDEQHGWSEAEVPNEP